MDQTKNSELIVLTTILTGLISIGIVDHNLIVVTTTTQNQKPQTTFASINNKAISSDNTVTNHNTKGNTREWIDELNNIKIEFSYLPIYPFIDNVTVLKFNVSDLKTGNQMKNIFARIVIINNFTAKYDSVSAHNGDFILFDNITAPVGIFSIRYQFIQEGEHQILARIASQTFSTLASFNVLVSSPE